MVSNNETQGGHSATSKCHNYHLLYQRLKLSLILVSDSDGTHAHTCTYITTKVKANIPEEASLTNYVFHKFTMHVPLSVHAVSLSARQDYPLGRKLFENVLG